ncbi:nucleoside triphosphate pyrophosphohydrolase family protein, partial [Candidatus Hakubella thermalkaliphila]
MSGKEDLKYILEQLLKFRKERDWEQFHRPKELAISIVLEAAELLEEFQWKTDEDIKRHLKEGGLEKQKKLIMILETVQVERHIKSHIYQWMRIIRNCTCICSKRVYNYPTTGHYIKATHT